MFYKLFNDCGKKIQNIAEIIFILTITASIVLLFISFSIEAIFYCLLILISGILSSFFINGFGILVENAEENMKLQIEKETNEKE